MSEIIIVFNPILKNTIKILTPKMYEWTEFALLTPHNGVHLIDYDTFTWRGEPRDLEAGKLELMVAWTNHIYAQVKSEVAQNNVHWNGVNLVDEWANVIISPMQHLQRGLAQLTS